MLSTRLCTHNPSNSFHFCHQYLKTTPTPIHNTRNIHLLTLHQYIKQNIHYITIKTNNTTKNNIIQFFFFLTFYLLHMHITLHYMSTSRISSLVIYHHILLFCFHISHNNLRFLVVYYTYFRPHISRLTYTRHKTLYLRYIS